MPYVPPNTVPPTIRAYTQATSLEPTDAFIIDRIGTGTMYIEAGVVQAVTGRAIVYVLDGVGSAITTGNNKGTLYIPFSVTLGNVALTADQTGSCVIDIGYVAIGSYTGAFPTSITGSDQPTLSSAVEYYDGGLSGWTTAIPGGSVLVYKVVSTSTITRLTITLGAVG